MKRVRAKAESYGNNHTPGLQGLWWCWVYDGDGGYLHSDLSLKDRTFQRGCEGREAFLKEGNFESRASVRRCLAKKYGPGGFVLDDDGPLDDLILLVEEASA